MQIEHEHSYKHSYLAYNYIFFRRRPPHRCCRLVNFSAVQFSFFLYRLVEIDFLLLHVVFFLFLWCIFLVLVVYCIIFMYFALVSCISIVYMFSSRLVVILLSRFLHSFVLIHIFLILVDVVVVGVFCIEFRKSVHSSRSVVNPKIL